MPNARKIERISYEEMLELASLGAKVLQIRSVELGMKYGVPIHVRSSFSDVEGTWVVPEEAAMEKVVVSGVTASRDEAKITLEDLPDTPGIAAQLFAPLADANISVDMIVQNQAYDGTTDLTFTVPKGDRKRAIELLKDKVPELVGKDGERDHVRRRDQQGLASSASACARTPASRRRCSSCSRRRASTSS